MRQQAPAVRSFQDIQATTCAPKPRKRPSVNHITSTTCVGTCACKCFLFLCKQIYMHVYASTVHMPFCFEGYIIYTFWFFLHVFFSSRGDWAISSTCHFVIFDDGVVNFKREQTGTTGLRIECLVQQPKQTESHHLAWNLLNAARFSVLKLGDFLRHAVWPPQDATG